jgi:hypothetical protein
VIAAWRIIDIGLFDVRDGLLAGDQTNFVMQAQSLRHGLNLSYDADDLRRWVEFGWADKPYGLFYRETDTGWIFAKPYGYSAYLVPFIWLLGDARGIAVANAVLLGALVTVVVAVLRLRLRGPAVPLAATAVVFASSAYFYGWVVHTEVFLATGVGLACWLLIKHLDSRSYPLAVAATVVVAFLFSEKATMAFVFAPVLVVLLLRLETWRRRVGVLAAGCAAVLIFAAPYLWYSGGEGWNPYQGDRYYSLGEVPFDGASSGTEIPTKNTDRDSFFSIDVLKRISRESEDIPRSAMTTLIGRHTGLLAFAPMALFALAATIRRWRTVDASGRALFAGVVTYLSLYVLLTPGYYVGGASFGNRYFVQISTVTVALLALIPVRTATIVRAAGASAALSVVLLWPHHVAPRTTYSERLDVTTPIQRLLPGESQLGNWETFNGPGEP